ncbi:uncharacterized protein LOC131294614 [Anopheles ziemanni]|uniref:uncharacterized protein LOC131263488 n=1 Tax=Anopheles coustani TaxID=139045 RepID=UPI002659F04E|nr:uncharacterized protein LOC131263488 [Anopheles coustani]XP_058178643.1 uncharacterized protein LOC131294614 [Anopheles ziemanni]
MSVIIRLQKLPLTANASDVRSFFRGLSIPDGGVHIVGGELGDAFIAFSTDEDARQAMALNGGRINGEPIMLLLSSRAEMQKVIDQARKAALSYMQMSRVVPTVVAASATGVMSGLQKVALPETKIQPSIIPQAVGALGAIASVAASLPRFNNPPPALNNPAVQQKPQPPVISLSGFLANAVRNPLGGSSLPTPASATSVPSGGSMATQSSAYGSMLSQGSSYNEIPGLSVGNPVDTSPSLSVNNLSGWLSALNGQLQTKAPSTSLNGGIDTSFLANSVTPVNLNGQQKDANSENSWKFLKKERRSRSTSRERGGYKRSGRSRSSSRDRDLKRDRRSRSSSRGRSYKRNGRSRSSSRDRGSRSWSRDSSRDYSRRYRNSRSRSSSRDRFGRTRQRSRSRSPRNHQNSRDRSMEPSGNPYDRDIRQGQNRPWASNFSGRTAGYNGSQQTQQWNGMDKGFPGNSKPMDAGGMTRHVEPIFGLHTQGSAQSGGMHFLPSRSGKISPLPTSNGALSSGADGGGPFRNTSPLPESVYSINFNNGGITNDYSVKVSNLDSLTGYGEIRRFFKSQVISNQGIKMINDQNGRRTGVAYVQFLHKDGKRRAMSRDGSMLRLMRLRIESITDQEFEQAIDSYRPGMDVKDYQPPQQQQNHMQQQQQQQQNTQPWGASGTGSSWNAHGKDSSNDTNDQSGRKQQKAVEYQPTSTLKVWNLPTFSTEQDIMKMFSDFTVVEVLIVKNHLIPKQLDGYVRFHRQEDAKEAWLQVHRHYIGNKKVSVRMCPELDYVVAKNEYENPGVASPNAADAPKDPEDGRMNSSDEQPSGAGESTADGGMDRENDNQSNGDTSGNNGEAGSERSMGSNERRDEEGGNGAGNGNRRTGGGARKKRWDTEKNWDEEEGNPRVAIKALDNAPQRQTDSDAGAGSDTNSSWVDRNMRMNSGDDRESSQTGDYGNGNGENNNNMRNRRMQQGSSGGRGGGGGRFSSGNSVDNGDMFQRTTCLLLRNVDFQVFEEDVFQFFAQDGFQAKNVLLVHNERGKRTGECLVEFNSPSEAAHAESKSSQNLGRRKVFASHLDRGQVADMMKHFDAISTGVRENPEDSQGVGCGPYRTSTVGLLNLAYKTTEEDVQNFFREFDLPLENIRRRFLDNGQATGEAMVRFANHIDAEKALNEYQNRKLFGRNVRIRLINDD